MNFSSKLRVILAFAPGSIWPALALTVNDGSTTNNLIQLSNANGAGAATATLTSGTNGYLIAAQSDVSDDFALRTVWYASGVVATGGVYTVSTDFEPASDSIEYRGGVIGWLNLSTSNAISFQVRPGDSFQVSVIDFEAVSGSENESTAHLFNLDGTPATSDLTSAGADLGNYVPTNFATFQLAFSVPTLADLGAVSNATVHVTAKVFQANDLIGPLQISRTVELLTDLPLPAPGDHRFGYFALWANIILPGEVIGFLDNLVAEGAVGAAPNSPPSVRITNPGAGANFTEPANIPIAADATDSDGTVRRVDFFAGAMLLGGATNTPFSLTWSNVAAGNYTLTAQATDDRGATSTSGPVDITVSTSTVGGPILTIVRAGDAIEISWPTTGYQLQIKTNLSSPTWTDVPNTTNTSRITLPITSQTLFFRLVQVSAAGGPKLMIQPAGDSVVISWPVQVSGYRLQSKTDLNAPTWTDIMTAGNQVTETIRAGSKFYRLIKSP